MSEVDESGVTDVRATVSGTVISSVASTGLTSDGDGDKAFNNSQFTYLWEDYGDIADPRGFSESEEALIIIMYTMITLLAVGGNTLVCYVVLAYQRMRTITNYFIVNLAVGDILMACLCIVPTFVESFLYKFWPYGRALCGIIQYIQAVVVLVSAYTLVTISIDRYLAIIYPLRPRMGGRTARLLILGVWLFALGVALPIPVKSRLSDKPFDPGRYECREIWDPEWGGRLYSSALLVLQFVLPFIVLTLTYSHICYTLWGSRTPGEAEDARDQRMSRSKRKMIKMMVIVVLLFALLWLPLNIFLIVGETMDWHIDHAEYYFFVFHWMAMSHSCVNPFIYGWMNSRFRQGFQHAFRFLTPALACCCPALARAGPPSGRSTIGGGRRMRGDSRADVSTMVDGHEVTMTTHITRPTSYLRNLSFGAGSCGHCKTDTSDSEPHERSHWGPRARCDMNDKRLGEKLDEIDEQEHTKCCGRKRRQHGRSHKQLATKETASTRGTPLINGTADTRLDLLRAAAYSSNGNGEVIPSVEDCRGCSSTGGAPNNVNKTANPSPAQRWGKPQGEEIKEQVPMMKMNGSLSRL